MAWIATSDPLRGQRPRPRTTDPLGRDLGKGPCRIVTVISCTERMLNGVLDVGVVEAFVTLMLAGRADDIQASRIVSRNYPALVALGHWLHTFEIQEAQQIGAWGEYSLRLSAPRALQQESCPFPDPVPDLVRRHWSCQVITLTAVTSEVG